MTSHAVIFPLGTGDFDCKINMIDDVPPFLATSAPLLQSRPKDDVHELEATDEKAEKARKARLLYAKTYRQTINDCKAFYSIQSQIPWYEPSYVISERPSNENESAASSDSFADSGSTQDMIHWMTTTDAAMCGLNDTTVMHYMLCRPNASYALSSVIDTHCSQDFRINVGQVPRLGTISPSGPHCPTPAGIKVELYMHQQLSLHRMKWIESWPYASHDCGFLADPPGYGKSLTALALVQDTPVLITVDSERVKTKSILPVRYNLIRDICMGPMAQFKARGLDRRDFFNSCLRDKQYGPGAVIVKANLFIVPRHLFFQWRYYIEQQTSLEYAGIECPADFVTVFGSKTPDEAALVKVLNSVQVLLIKTSLLDKFVAMLPETLRARYDTSHQTSMHDNDGAVDGGDGGDVDAGEADDITGDDGAQNIAYRHAVSMLEKHSQFRDFDKIPYHSYTEACNALEWAITAPLKKIKSEEGRIDRTSQNIHAALTRARKAIGDMVKRSAKIKVIPPATAEDHIVSLDLSTFKRFGPRVVAGLVFQRVFIDEADTIAQMTSSTCVLGHRMWLISGSVGNFICSSRNKRSMQFFGDSHSGISTRNFVSSYIKSVFCPTESKPAAIGQIVRNNTMFLQYSARLPTPAYTDVSFPMPEDYRLIYENAWHKLDVMDRVSFIEAVNGNDIPRAFEVYRQSRWRESNLSSSSSASASETAPVPSVSGAPAIDSFIRFLKLEVEADILCGKKRLEELRQLQKKSTQKISRLEGIIDRIRDAQPQTEDENESTEHDADDDPYLVYKKQLKETREDCEGILSDICKTEAWLASRTLSKEKLAARLAVVRQDVKCCPVCLESISTAVVFKCMHHLCQQCFKEVMSTSGSSKTNQFPCVVCRLPVQINQVDRIQINTSDHDNDNAVAEEDTMLDSGNFDIDRFVDPVSKMLNMDAIKSSYSKIGYIVGDILAAPEAKRLVFSKYAHVLKKIEAILSAINIPCAMLKGTVKEISGVLDRFNRSAGNTRAPVLLLDAKQFGAGLNITETDRIYLYHRMSSELEGQIVARACRIGACKPVQVYRLFFHAETAEAINLPGPRTANDKDKSKEKKKKNRSGSDSDSSDDEDE